MFSSVQFTVAKMHNYLVRRQLSECKIHFMLEDLRAEMDLAILLLNQKLMRSLTS